MFDENSRIILYSKPVKLFKGFDSLLSIVLTELKMDLTPNTFVLFLNEDKDRFKMLFLHYNQIAIFSMRLEGTLISSFGETREFNKQSFNEFITRLKKGKRRIIYSIKN